MLAYVYVSPPWQGLISFYTDDSASVRPGDQVRIAGITVGTVKDLSLESDQVRVRMRVDRDVFVGDQSQVDVRMLTVVGGFYVNINSIGDNPIGEASIPRERVTMPYSLIQALSDTTKITQNVEPKPINESLNQIQEGLGGENVGTIAAIVEAGNALTEAIDRQRGQVTSILNTSGEYIRSLTDYREELIELVNKISIVIQTLTLYSKGFAGALDGLGEAVLGLKPVADSYENHRVAFIEKVRQYQQKFREFVERNDLTVRFLHRLQNLFDRILDAQNARPALLATDVCIPIAGSTC